MAKRYQVFAYDQYYPGGGMSDWRAEYDTLEEAQAHEVDYDYIEVADSETWQVVWDKDQRNRK